MPPIFASNNLEQVKATCDEFEITVDEFRDLQRHCATAAAAAYCPYSQFPVGAALLTRYGVQLNPPGGNSSKYILGANIENASYPIGTCAERVALGTAVFEGHREFKALAVLAPANAPGMAPCSPCGMCRQYIREFCGLDMPIIMFSKNGEYMVVRLEALLPLSFGPEALGAANTASQA